jgi:hypothetical protein
MENIVRMLEDHTSWKESMRKCCRSNKLNIDIAAFFTPLRFRASYSKFKAMYAYLYQVMKKKVQIKMKDGYKMNLKHFIGSVWPSAA